MFAVCAVGMAALCVLDLFVAQGRVSARLAQFLAKGSLVDAPAFELREDAALCIRSQIGPHVEAQRCKRADAALFVEIDEHAAEIEE